MSRIAPTDYRPPFSVTYQRKLGLFEISYLLPTGESTIFCRHLSRIFPLFQLPACADDPVWLLQCSDSQTLDQVLLIVHNETLTPLHPKRVQRQEFFDRMVRVGQGYCVVSDEPPLTPPQITPPSTPPAHRSDLCIVCGATREVRFEFCAHCVYCETCWHRAASHRAECPICRIQVDEFTIVRLA